MSLTKVGLGRSREADICSGTPAPPPFPKSPQPSTEYYEVQTYSQTLQIFEKFVPKQFLRRIAVSGVENICLGEAKTETLTILFSDIRDFTAIAESLSEEETFHFLNSYFALVEPVIQRHHGFVDKFIGDAVMALFTQAKDAVNAAIEIQGAMRCMPSLRLGIGINTGPVMIGIVGTENRMESTVIGDAVNLAARLESLTKTYQSRILISGSTYQALNAEKFYIREIDTTRIKGKTQPVTVYEVFDADPPEVLQKKKSTLPILRQGIELIKAMKVPEAMERFEECLTVFPQDVVVGEYVKRSYYLNEFKLNRKHQFQTSIQKLKHGLKDYTKRKSERFSCFFPLNLHLMKQGEHLAAHMLDISATGLRIETRWEIEITATVMVEVYFLTPLLSEFVTQQPLRLLGRVIWKQACETAERKMVNLYGVQFLQLSQLDEEHLQHELDLMRQNPQ